jgi:hypothetical protein
MWSATETSQLEIRRGTGDALTGCTKRLQYCELRATVGTCRPDPQGPCRGQFVRLLVPADRGSAIRNAGNCVLVDMEQHRGRLHWIFSKLLLLLSVIIAVAGAAIAQSVLQLATGKMVLGSNRGEGVWFSAHVYIAPGAPPSLICNGYRVIPVGKAAGAWR